MSDEDYTQHKLDRPSNPGGVVFAVVVSVSFLLCLLGAALDAVKLLAG